MNVYGFGLKIYSKSLTKASTYSHGNSSRSSIQMLPIISGLVEKQTAEIGKLFYYFITLLYYYCITLLLLFHINSQSWFTEYGALQEGSLSSTNSVNKFWLGPSDNTKEDLYFWMAKQQENKKKEAFAEKEILRPTPVNKMPGNVRVRPGIMQDSITLLDAHLIFEPLLTCLGVMPQQMINKFSNTGGRIWFMYFYHLNSL